MSGRPSAIPSRTAATSPATSAARSWASALSPPSSVVATAATARRSPSIVRIPSTDSSALGVRVVSTRRTAPDDAVAAAMSSLVATGHGATSGTGDEATITCPSGHITTTEVSRPEISDTRLRATRRTSLRRGFRIGRGVASGSRESGKRVSSRVAIRSTDADVRVAGVIEQERLQPAIEREPEHRHDRRDEHDVRDRQLPADGHAGQEATAGSRVSHGGCSRRRGRIG